MKVVATAVLAAALIALPTGAFAAKKRVYVESSTHVSPPPAPVYPQPCATVVCEPACPQPCFNPLSIVGGVVSGVGCAISSIGSGISGIFGTCSPCPPAPCY